MNTPIHNSLPHFNQERLDLRRRQSCSLKWPAAQSRHAIHDRRPPEQTTKSEVLIRRPEPEGQLLRNLGNFLKAGLAHLLRSLLDGAYVGAHGLEAGSEELEGVAGGIWSIWCEGVIVATWITDIDLLDFKSSRLA